MTFPILQLKPPGQQNASGATVLHILQVDAPGTSARGKQDTSGTSEHAPVPNENKNVCLLHLAWTAKLKNDHSKLSPTHSLINWSSS